ncbi:MAG: hypothetical protein V1922_02505 [bacterium]
MAIIAQAELVGQPFNRHFHIRQAGDVVNTPQRRVVRIGLLLNDETADIGFRAALRLPYAIDFLPHIPLKGRIFDSVWQKPSLSTARKGRASSPFVDTDAALIARGATLETPIKTKGFAYTATKGEMTRERKRKKVEKTHGQEVAAVLLNNHTGPLKKRGFAFMSSPYEIAQERKRKMLLARQIRAQMKNSYLEFP